VALIVGAFLGAVDRALVAWIWLPALVVTLGVLVVAQGMQMVLASNETPAGSVLPLSATSPWRASWASSG
jgi:ribose/xylose/arabinose/galactoside ABC-type transport system permease subunit